MSHTVRNNTSTNLQLYSILFHFANGWTMGKAAREYIGNQLSSDKWIADIEYSDDGDDLSLVLDRIVIIAFGMGMEVIATKTNFIAANALRIEHST